MHFEPNGLFPKYRGAHNKWTSKPHFSRQNLKCFELAMAEASDSSACHSFKNSHISKLTLCVCRLLSCLSCVMIPGIYSNCVVSSKENCVGVPICPKSSMLQAKAISSWGTAFLVQLTIVRPETDIYQERYVKIF